MKEPLGLFIPRDWSSEPEVSIESALDRRDYATAAVELIRLGARVMDGDENASMTQLAAWLDRLPPEWNSPVTPLRSLVLFQSQNLIQAELGLKAMMAEFGTGQGFLDVLPDTDWLLPLRAFQGTLYVAMGLREQAQAAFADAREMLARHKPEHPAEVALAVPPEEAERLKGFDRYGLTPLILDALDFYQAVGATAATARMTQNLGQQYLEIGEPARARYWLERTLELRQNRPGLLPLAFTLGTLGFCYRQLGMLDEAQAVLDEGLRLGSRLESKLIQASGLTHLGDVYRDRGEATTALELYRKSLALRSEQRDSVGLALTHLSLSILYRRQQQYGLAAEAAAEAVSLSQGYGEALAPESLALHQCIARLLIGEEGAAAELRLLVERVAERHHPGDEALGRWYLARAAMAAGEPALVRKEIEQALTLASHYRRLHLLACELPVTADLCRVAVEQGIYPDMLAGLIQRATAHGLARMLEQVPAVAPIVAAAGRLAEARALSVRLLGPFRVAQAGREVNLSAARSHKAVSLFKLLVAHRGRPLPREQILDAIWPESDPEAADRSFEVTLSTLRRLLDPRLGQPLILRRGRGYLLNPDVSLDLDVDQFTAHLERGNWWWQRKQAAPAESEWVAAEQVYRGDFLAEDPYDDWATAERERLKEQYLDLVTRLAELDFQAGRNAEAITRANRVLTQDPIRERAFRLLMQAHARQGNRAVALRAFRRYAEELQRELGEAPAAETRELARRISAGEVM